MIDTPNSCQVTERAMAKMRAAVATKFLSSNPRPSSAEVTVAPGRRLKYSLNATGRYAVHTMPLWGQYGYCDSYKAEEFVSLMRKFASESPA